MQQRSNKHTEPDVLTALIRVMCSQRQAVVTEFFCSFFYSPCSHMSGLYPKLGQATTASSSSQFIIHAIIRRYTVVK